MAPANISLFDAAADTQQSAVEDGKHLHIHSLRKLPDAWRANLVAMSGEFVGTVLFLYIALGGTQVANNIPSSSGLTVAQTGSNPQQLQYIALCFGFSLAVNAWVFFRISGGLFNPAVTFGMCIIGAVPWFRGLLLFIVQIIGGIAAAGLVACMFPGQTTVNTTLGGGTSIAQGLFIEMILTAVLVFAIFMLAAEKHKGTYISPVGIGLALFVCELVGVYFTGGRFLPVHEPDCRLKTPSLPSVLGRYNICSSSLTYCSHRISQPCPLVRPLRHQRKLHHLPLE
jgi:aquaporin related protein